MRKEFFSIDPLYRHLQWLNASNTYALQKQPPEVFHKKSVLKKFAKITGKRQCQSLFFNKFAGLRSATLLKKRLWHRHFSVNFAQFVSIPILKNICERLFLAL